MDQEIIIKQRALRYYLRLNYPVRTQMYSDLCVASHPDLPGCEVRATSPREAFVKLEALRQRWLFNAISISLPVPSPNDYVEQSREFSVAPYLLGNDPDPS